MTAVITGVGCASAFGLGAPALMSGLAEGRAAVAPIRGFDARAFPTRVAGEVPLFGDALLACLPRHDAAWDHDGTLRDRKVVFALLAAAEAWASSRGCRTIAADARVENDVGRALHARLGYEETGTRVRMRKRIDAAAAAVAAEGGE